MEFYIPIESNKSSDLYSEFVKDREKPGLYIENIKQNRSSTSEFVHKFVVYNAPISFRVLR